jgi:hypothetical protein
LADNQKEGKKKGKKETLEMLPNISFHSQGRNIAVTSLACLCKFQKDNFGQWFIWDKSEVLLENILENPLRIWETCWKLIGNMMGTHWKLKGMI